MQSLSSPPHFISPEEHDSLTSSTPTSFADIPPVLRHEETDCEVVLEPALSWMGSGRVTGKLWVTEAALSFLPSSSSSSTQGFTLTYPALTLHAISSASGPSPDESACIYCQIDDPTAAVTDVTNGTNGNGKTANGEDEDDDSEDNDEEDTPMREMKIFVTDSTSIEPLFSALSHCASLYPSLSQGGNSDNQQQAFDFFGGAVGGSDDTDEDEGVEEGAFDDATETENGGPGVDRGEYQTGDSRFRPY